MKKVFIVFLSIMMIVVIFSSCNKITEETPQDKVSEETHQDKVSGEMNTLPNESLTDDWNAGDVPSIERYAFSSIEDFKIFCTTGSRDSTLYDSPPKDDAFPPYNMLEGCFVDITQLFPGLDENNVTIDHIEISSNGRYSYSGYTNISKTPFSISIKYENQSSEVTVASVAAATTASTYNQVILADYYEAKNTVSSSEGLTLYVFELSNCIVQYNVYKEKIQGMVIHSGDYEIGLSPGYSDNDAFFTDETLESVSCMFKEGEDRVEALSRVSNFAISD